MSLRRARIAVGVAFGAHAAAFATWAARIPTIRDDLGLDNGDLGIALSGLAAGMFAGTRLTGRMERDARTGLPLRVVTPLLCLSIVGPGFARDLVTLTIGLAVFGVLGGLLDVVMNAHAVAVERLYRRPIMSSLHGLWSLGTMAGSAVAALLARSGVDVRVHFVVAAVLLAVASALPLAGALSHQAEAATTAEHHETSALTGAQAGLAVVLLLGLMGFGSFLVEGAVADWSAVFLTDERAAAPGFAALGLAVFAGAMAVSRLVGDRLGLRLGPVRLGRLGAGTALVGFAVALLVPSASAGRAGRPDGLQRGRQHANPLPAIRARPGRVGGVPRRRPRPGADRPAGRRDRVDRCAGHPGRVRCGRAGRRAGAPCRRGQPPRGQGTARPRIAVRQDAGDALGGQSPVLVVGRAHQPDRVAVRIFHDRVARAPERVVRRLPARVTRGDQRGVELVDGVSTLDRDPQDGASARQPRVAAVPHRHEADAVERDAGSAREVGHGMAVAGEFDLPAESAVEVQCHGHIGDDDIQLRERQRPVHSTILAAHVGADNNDDSRRDLRFLNVLVSRTVDQVA